MSVINQAYELSVWDDIIVPKYSNLSRNSRYTNNTTTYWTGSSSTISALNGELTAIGNGALSYFDMSSSTGTIGQIGDKIYMSGKGIVANSGCVSLALRLNDGAGSTITIFTKSSPVLNTWYNLSGIALTDSSGSINGIVRSTYADAASTTGKSTTIKDILILNLTALFGAGKEPSKNWCDNYFAYTKTSIEEHFDEVKSVVVGSNTLDTPLRAHNINLKENINGERTLTFNVLSKYKDDLGVLSDNPFIGLLTNEKKLKLRIGDAYSFSTDILELMAEDTEERWLDFVIKTKDEDSENYLNTFTAKEIFVNELGKNGYDVLLDTELENNYGTVSELGAKVLEDSGWTIGAESYSPTESMVQPLLKTTLLASLSAKQLIPTNSVNVSIQPGTIIYPSYNSVVWDSLNNKWIFKTNEIQFLYKDGAPKTEIPYNLNTWEEWILRSVGAILSDNTGLSITNNGVSYLHTNYPIIEQSSTKFGVLSNIVFNNCSGGSSGFIFVNGGVGASNGVGISNGFTGYHKGILTTTSITTHFRFYSTGNLDGTIIKTKDVRLFELQSGSQIETDFNTLTASELISKYPFEGLTFSDSDTDDKKVIIDDSFTYNYSTIEVPNTSNITLTGSTDDALQANIIMKTINSHFDSVNDEYIKEYKVLDAASGASVNDIVYGNTETQYLTSSIVTNYLTNYKNFISPLAWLPQGLANSPVANSLPLPVLTSNISIINIGGSPAQITFTLPNADSIGKITYNPTIGAKVSYYYKAEDYGGAPSGGNYNFSIPATAFSTVALTTGTYSLTYSLNSNQWATLNPTNYLTLQMNATNNYIYNEGPTNIRLGLIKDKIYVVRTKARMIKKGITDYGTNGQDISIASQPVIKAELGTYASGVFTSKTSEGTISLINTQLNGSTDTTIRGYGAVTTGNDTRQERIRYINASSGTANVDELRYSYTYIKASASTLASTDKIHLRIKNTGTSTTHDYYIEDIQVFEYIEDVNNVPIFLGDIPTAEIRFANHYYYLDGNDNKVSLVENDAYYTPEYKANYEAVRHLDIKQSNYFNNITSLAELFEVWVRFKIYHQKNGKILLDSTGAPRKEVIFSRYSPNGDVVNYSGFKYGINLKGIKRSNVSSSLATKVIVKNNNQEFAVDGTCSIRRAHDNPSGDNEIYIFDYFVNQGLISNHQILADLYGMSSTDLGLYPKLYASNQILNTNLALIAKYEDEILISTNFRDMAQEALDTVAEEILFQESLVASSINDINAKEKALAAISTLEAQQIAFQASFNAYDANATYYTNLKNTTNTTIIEPELLAKKTLKKNFYKKYSRFIQEGTWTDDKYVDDNLYYLDALKVASVSAYPKISYQIDVIDVNGIEEYAAYEFKIGERTYVEDTEFFGWVNKNPNGAGNVATPFKMEVIVSERTRNFDDLSKSTITIQNYKNQFEELFQKITAATTQLQYESGGYGRAAAAIKPNGEIEVSTLEQAMENNAFTLSNSKNQSVIWDSNRGIEITDTSNSSLKLRIVAGGLFMTTDGGRTWASGITGLGINTNYLLAGQIDASKINIISNGKPIFRWDSEGISAFYNEGAQYDGSRYVRFNQYGMYGTTNGLALAQALSVSVTYADKLQAIRDHSNFSLTWEGLMLQYQDGAVSLSPEEGLQVFDANDVERVRLGKFLYSKDGVTTIYGLKLSDSTGAATLETDASGNLWLQKYLNVNDEAGISSEIDIGGDPIDDVRFWAGGAYTNRNDTTTKFRITKSGYLYATNALLSGDIEANNLTIVNGAITDSLYVGTDINKRILIDGLYNVIRSSNSAWSIDGSGQAVFNNARIRGTLETVVFKYDEVTAVSGSLLVTNSAALEQDLVIGAIGTTVAMKATLSYDLFAIGNVLAIPMVVGTLSKTGWFRVVSKDANNMITIIITTDSELASITIPMGSTVLNFGNGSTAPGIMIKGYGTSAPYIDLFQATRSGTEAAGLSYDFQDIHPIVRLGNLSGITDVDFGPLSGNGLYATNIYLKGKIIANDAQIINSTMTGNLYAGTLDTDNILISDRRVAGSQDDWKFIIHPDDGAGDVAADKDHYKFLMVEQGVFNRNYNWMFYPTDGDSTDLDAGTNNISTDAIFAKIDSAKQAIVGNKIGSTYWLDSYLYQTELYKNNIRFSSTTKASIDGSYSDNFLNSFFPNLSIGLYQNAYAFIAGTANGILTLGAAVNAETGFTSIDTGNRIKVGINTTTPVHELDVAHSVGIAERLYFTSASSDKIKIEKHINENDPTAFDLDIYLL